MPFCEKCGEQVGAEAAFCWACGARVEKGAARPKADETASRPGHTDGPPKPAVRITGTERDDGSGRYRVVYHSRTDEQTRTRILGDLADMRWFVEFLRDSGDYDSIHFEPIPWWQWWQ